MQFFSTRDYNRKVTSSEAIAQGLSGEGGLFVPETFPQVEIVLYRYDGSHCLAIVDGTPTCLVSRADAVNLMETVRSIVLGGEESGG